MIHPDEQVNTLMMADLGNHLVGAITATMTLGHTRLAHTLVYGAGGEHSAAALLVRAVIKGEIGAVTEALGAWAADSARWCEAVEAATGRHVEPATPLTATDVQRAAMARVARQLLPEPA